MSATVIMALAAKTSREALYSYESGMEDLTANLKAANTKAETLIESAQAICGHEYVEQVRVPYTGGLPPNFDYDDIPDPTYRMDCTICNKQGVM